MTLPSLAQLPAPPSAPPTPVAGTPRGPLSRRAKAAIIVQFIINEGAEVRLSALPEDLQAHLTQQLGAMRYIDRNTMNSVLQEFADELESVGLSFPGGIAGALSALDGKISAQTARRLRKEAGVRQIGDPWMRIAALEVDKLMKIVLSESTEVAAVMISKLDVTKAAALLSKLPGEKARRITYAVSLTSRVTPDAVDRIGLSLAAQLDAEPPMAFAAAAPERVGAILNFSKADTREDVLSGLEETDSDFADAVRRAIFTFANIPARIRAEDVPKISRDVDQDTLITAMAAAASPEDKAATEFILDGLSKRMSGTLREGISERGKIKTKEGEAAQTEVIVAIRALLESGEITLKDPDEEEETD